MRKQSRVLATALACLVVLLVFLMCRVGGVRSPIIGAAMRFTGPELASECRSPVDRILGEQVWKAARRYLQGRCMDPHGRITSCHHDRRARSKPWRARNLARPAEIPRRCQAAAGGGREGAIPPMSNS